MLQEHPQMKSRISSTDDDEGDGDDHAAYLWWRSAAGYEECARLAGRPEAAASVASVLSPRVRVLREMERLALVAPEGLDEVRQKLFAYRAGDFWVPTGGLSKEEMDIPATNTVLLAGFAGSGKSSLVNLMYSVLGRAGLIPFAQTSSGKSSSYTTMYLEEHNVVRSLRSGFCVYDSRGFDYGRIDEALEELSDWMSQGVHHNQLCSRPGDRAFSEDEAEFCPSRSSSKFMKRRVNCVMVVVNIAEVHKAMKAGDFEQLRATKELFSAPALRKCNESPLLILTHGDLLTPEERVEARLKICECLGIPEASGVYDIVCLTEYGFLAEEADPITAYSLAEAVYRALLISDRGHVPKNDLRDWACVAFSCLMWLFGALFSFLAVICNKLGQRRKGLRI
ncbi:uncharacterized protein LOC115673443 [Syzygium oleosum]|uniref:uncharacterized protein LOC115673443 n=1 Tax=Syzygium oleosum TaxID=219896 RepID=UPI0011D1870D|nr:uncharacterized protein LOC115673443 [Syzygium oleosum]